MKYISIDIETTGLDPENNQILSVGAIIEDTNNPRPFEEIPKFHVAIKHEQITGSPFAINMNKGLIESIVQYQTSRDQDEKNDLVNFTGMKFLNREEVAIAFFDFLWDNRMIEMEQLDMESFIMGERPSKIVNGKRYPIPYSGMPVTYINAAGKNFGTFDKLFLEQLPRWKQLFKFRSRIIDPSILFVDWKSDESLPSLNDCKKRANITGEVTHNALEDAWDVIQILRKTYNQNQ